MTDEEIAAMTAPQLVELIHRLIDELDVRLMQAAE